MGLVIWVVVGAITGLVARRIVPAPDPGRFIVAVLLGMAGASSGGFVVGVLGGPGATDANALSVLVAMACAIGVLYLFGLITGGTA